MDQSSQKQVPYIEAGSILKCAYCNKLILMANNDLFAGDHVAAEDYCKIIDGKKEQVQEHDMMVCHHCGDQYSKYICDASNWSDPNV